MHGFALGFSFFQVKTLMLKPRPKQRAVHGGKRKSQTQNEHVDLRRCFFPKSIVFDGHLTQNDMSHNLQNLHIVTYTVTYSCISYISHKMSTCDVAMQCEQIAPRTSFKPSESRPQMEESNRHEKTTERSSFRHQTWGVFTCVFPRNFEQDLLNRPLDYLDWVR